MWRRLLLSVMFVIALLWALNTSLWIAPPPGEARLIAHRGVHQTYAGPPPVRDTCTATPITPVTHGFIENTLPSMQAAFDAGADVIELDIHLTPDNVFAVFHDWTIDCRTEGTGQTNRTPWETLARLDVGYRYSEDGTSFPLRGSGVGLMPRLEEVFTTFPERRFLINFKSDDPNEGAALVDLLRANPGWRAQVWAIYGGERPARVVTDAFPEIKTFSRASIQACGLRYIALGWTSYVPEACRGTILALPIDVAPFVWGWPRRFERRMAAHGTELLLLGPMEQGSTAGIDTPAQLTQVPDGFAGWVWTDRAEVVGPLLR
ncbi:glycerophosphodiester phosphodiesterase family protein [Pseudaestuariivita sp.]|uniref:glycerophosphodiester phosphodiesterase family protein n=1 Tax=Pseudaestuariivita sp. TaxID=2211669 RepID=UPI004057EB79